MARLVNQGGCLSQQLSTGWAYLSAAAGEDASPSPVGDWVQAAVPGTVAATGGDLHARDHWYRLEMVMPGGAWLEFDGLATLAEIWMDGGLIARSSNMFLPMRVVVPSGGAQRLEICFRALRPALRRRLPGRRARWRSRLTTEEGLRGYRTTLLGHMPGWSGDAAVVGPFRSIVLHQPVVGRPLVDRVDLRVRVRRDGMGLISLRLDGTGLDDHPGTVTAGGQTVDMIARDGALVAELLIPDPPLWWPHTHGRPVTWPVTADIGGCSIELGQVGFRTIGRRDPADGFGLVVNDIPVFCRGAIWTGLDPSGQVTPKAKLASALRLAQQAGLNMLRVTGLTMYEHPDFFDCCDALGIMVWHDFMFTRFDYPDSNEFMASVLSEARAFLTMAQAHPCLAVLCGGSEIAQAAAMAGCPPDTWRTPLLNEVLAEEAASLCPDVPYIAQSPLSDSGDGVCGGLPFAAAASVAHYFGVGAYQRPLSDLSLARVRFAAECLAFANPPVPASDRFSASTLSVPRDQGTDWDFADVRDHYAKELFGPLAASARRQNPATWLAYGRATVALIMQQAFATWRTDGHCAGALVLMLQDLVPGAGWGVIANDGRPKSAWHALQSVCQPVQVLLRDLGQNGIVVHAINESDTPRRMRIGLRGLSPDGVAEALGSTILTLEPRASQAIAATTLMGRWRDLANAWQFGLSSFDVLGATLDDTETGARLSDSVVFPSGPALARTHPGLTVSLDPAASTIAVSSQNFAQFVQIDDDNHVPAANYFHLWPGETRIVTLQAVPGREGLPNGTVSALNGYADAHYGIAA